MLIYFLVSFMTVAYVANARYIMYLTGCVGIIFDIKLVKLKNSSQHNVVPEKYLVSDLTHVALAFMSPAIFNQRQLSSFPLFTTVERVRTQFPEETAIMIAIGGWGDTEGFEVAAATDQSRKLFAQNVKNMVASTRADGELVDLSKHFDSHRS